MRQIPRLHVEARLAAGQPLTLDGGQAHYLGTVLRLEAGAEVHLFDGRSGEWAACVVQVAKRSVTLTVGAQRAPLESLPDLWLCAAPIRAERYEWVAEKATELGVARLVPVLTERVNHARLKPERLWAHMVEAAEQCGRTALPVLAPAVKLANLLADWPAERALLFADEGGGAPMAAFDAPAPAAILIGPEGGFSEPERTAILALAATRRLSLGPRILRADTAAVAAVAVWQARDPQAVSPAHILLARPQAPG